MIKLTVLVFVLAAFVLAAMRSMAQLPPAKGGVTPAKGGASPCDLPLEERPDYCTGNAPTLTPQASAEMPTPEISSYPGPAELPYPIRDGSVIFTSNLKNKLPKSNYTLPQSILDFCNGNSARPNHKYNFYCEVIHGLYP